MNELELKESIIRAGTGIDESTRAAIRAELTAELRGERATVVTPSVPPAQRDWRRPAALLAAAACVALVAAGIVAFTGRDDDATTVVSDSEPSVTPTTAGTTTVSPTTSPPAADLLSRLEGRRWIAIAADSAPITTPFVPWVEFSDTAESFLTGIDGCNGFGADGELDGDLLSVVQIGSRAMRCGETLPVITPLDGLRLELDPDGTTLHMFDEGGAERLTYAALDSFGAADGESFPALWWWPTGGTIPAIDIRADGTAGVGSCELTWSVTGGSVSVTGWPADPSSCRADTMDERTSRLIELLSGGAADVRIAPDGASLYLSDGQLVLRVVRETTDERPSDPSDVDMLAEWPMRPDLAPSIDAVPLLLPTVEVEGATDVVRTEWADGQAGHDEYVQAWVVDPGQVVLVTTRIGQHADPAAAAEPADVAGWDTAFFADSVPGVVILTLDDPSGTVTVWAKGIDSETVESFAGELARRDRAPGWHHLLDGWPQPIHEGWAMGSASRIVQWEHSDGIVAELDIFWGTPDLFVPWGFDADVSAVSLDDGRITGVGSLLPDRAAVVWSPAPDVVVRLGVVGSMDDALTLARSITAVDAATWQAASRLEASPPDGCDSLFC